MDLFDKLIAKIPAKPVIKRSLIKPVSENEESDSDQDLAVEHEDIEILEDNSQMVIDDSQNKDSQSKNSGSGDQIEDEDSPDLEIVSESTISGE